MIMPEDKKDIIKRLQKDILRWQGFTPPTTGQAKGVGLGPLETAFPNGVFPTGAIHEMVCATPEHTAATGGLIGGILHSLMQQGGACIWVSTSRTIFPPALTRFNIQPDKIVFIDLVHEKEVLWVMEQALKCPGLSAVIAEVKEISITQSRRLQLAVENSKVTGFLLRKDPGKITANTCVARWQVSHLPSEPGDELPGVGFPRWRIDLLRVRNGDPGSWKLEWADGSFIPVPEIHKDELAERRMVS
jgi:protein ImuA